MKANSRRLICPGIFIFGLFLLQPVMAQSLERQVVSSSGATFNEGVYTLDFTFGEIMTTTFEQGDELCQGFQQAWAVLTAIGSIPSEMDIKLYPNPTIDILHIELLAKTDLQILDLHGLLVMSLHLAAGDETIDVAELPAGTYFIRCIDVANRKKSAFKLVKLE